MNAKKVINFLVLRSAFTQRNVTSLGLVGIFFVVYLLSGGKVSLTSMPNIPRSDSFGGVALDQPVGGGQLPSDIRLGPDGRMDQDQSKALLGVLPSEDRAARELEIQKRGRLVEGLAEEEGTDETLDKAGLVQGDQTENRYEEARLKRKERKREDSLSAIEERLKARR